MPRHRALRFQLAVDVVFAAILAIFYLGLRAQLRPLEAELGSLFLAGYISLALGVVLLYLVFDLNQKLAMFMHAMIFPLLGTFYMFLKWLPKILETPESPLKGASPTAFSGSLLIFLILLFGFLLAQFQLYVRRKELEAT